MSWNYRILAFEHANLDKTTEVELRVCEVYYTKRGKPNGYIEAKLFSSFDGVKGLKWMLSKHREALTKPILYSGKKFPKIYKPKK